MILLKVLNLVVFSMLVFNVYGQDTFFISENHSDFLYGKIYNEVNVYSKNGNTQCNSQLKSDEALIIKKSCSTYLVKPMKDSGIIFLNYTDDNGQKDSFFYKVNFIPEPEVYVYPKRNYHAGKTSYLIDSITAVVYLSKQRVLNTDIESFSVSILKKGKLLKKMGCNGNRLSALQQAELKRILPILAKGDIILLEDIVLNVAETKKVIKKHSIKIY